MAKSTEEKEVVQEETKYSKPAILSGVKFLDNRDLLNVLLENDNEYSISEVEVKIKEFLEGVIK